MALLLSSGEVALGGWNGLSAHSMDDLFLDDGLGNEISDSMMIDFSFDDFLNCMEMTEDLTGEGDNIWQMQCSDVDACGADTSQSELVHPSANWQDESLCDQGSKKSTSRLKKRQKRFSTEQLRRLKDWVISHLQDPYVRDEDLKYLVESTGLSAKQIRIHFANYRKRNLQTDDPAPTGSLSQETASANPPGDSIFLKSKAETSSDEMKRISNPRPQPAQESHASSVGRQENIPEPVSSESHGSLLAGPASCNSQFSEDEAVEECSETIGLSGHMEDQPLGFRYYQGSFLDWFFESLIAPAGKNSKNHAAAVNDILHNCECTDGNHLNPCLIAKKRRTNSIDHKAVVIGGTRSSYLPSEGRRFSINSIDSNEDQDPRSEASSLAGSRPGSYGGSVKSGGSCASASAYASLGPRKGRRRYRMGSTPAQTNGRYACDSCASTFKTKYTRDRHTTSIHAPKRTWVCGPVPGFDAKECFPMCLCSPICRSHSMLSCWEKPEKDRTFYRKDGLVQHLRLVHGMEKPLDDQILRRLEWPPDRPASLHPTTAAPKPATLGLKPLDHLMQICWHEFVLRVLRNKQRVTAEERISLFQTCWHQTVAQVLEPDFTPTIQWQDTKTRRKSRLGQIKLTVTIPASGLRNLAKTCLAPKVVELNSQYREPVHGTLQQHATCVLVLTVFLITMAGDYPEYIEEIQILSGDWQLWGWMVSAIVNAPTSSAARSSPQLCDINLDLQCTSFRPVTDRHGILRLHQTWPWSAANVFSRLNEWS